MFRNKLLLSTLYWHFKNINICSFTSLNLLLNCYHSLLYFKKFKYNGVFSFGVIFYFFKLINWGNQNFINLSHCGIYARKRSFLLDKNILLISSTSLRVIICFIITSIYISVTSIYTWLTYRTLTFFLCLNY